MKLGDIDPSEVARLKRDITELRDIALRLLDLIEQPQVGSSVYKALRRQIGSVGREY